MGSVRPRPGIMCDRPRSGCSWLPCSRASRARIGDTPTWRNGCASDRTGQLYAAIGGAGVRERAPGRPGQRGDCAGSARAPHPVWALSGPGQGLCATDPGAAARGSPARAPRERVSGTPRRGGTVALQIGPGSFTPQSVVLEYVSAHLVAQASEEIVQGRLALLIQYGLCQAQARDYVRQTQERLLVAPLLARLESAYRGHPDVEERLRFRSDRAALRRNRWCWST